MRPQNRRLLRRVSCRFTHENPFLISIVCKLTKVLRAVFGCAIGGKKNEALFTDVETKMVLYSDLTSGEAMVVAVLVLEHRI